jgi:hypothetical protein
VITLDDIDGLAVPVEMAALRKAGVQVQLNPTNKLVLLRGREMVQSNAINLFVDHVAAVRVDHSLLLK